MRTATLRAKTFDGKRVTICDEDVPIHEQRTKFFNEFKPLQAHAEYHTVTFQPLDGPGQIHTIHEQTKPAKTK